MRWLFLFLATASALVEEDWHVFHEATVEVVDLQEPSLRRQRFRRREVAAPLPSSDHPSNLTLKVSFPKSMKASMNLQLEMDLSTFGANYKEVKLGADGKLRVAKKGAPRCVYRGTAQDENAHEIGRVRASLCGNDAKLRAVVMRQDDSALEIDYDETSKKHVLVDLKDRKSDPFFEQKGNNDITWNGAPDSEGLSSGNSTSDDGRRLRANECANQPSKIIEVVAVNDLARFNALGASTEARTSELFTLVNDLYYAQGTSSSVFGLYGPSILDCTVRVKLVGQITWDTTIPSKVVYAQGLTACKECHVAQNLPSAAETCNAQEISARCLLDSFSDWALKEARRDIENIFDLKHMDTAQLLTHREFSGSTIGLATVGVTCNPSYAAAVNDVDFSANLNLALSAILVAHEMGHGIGLSHDASGNGIMGSSLSVTGGQTLKPWSVASKTDANTFLQDGYGEFLTNRALPACLENDPSLEECLLLEGPGRVTLKGTSVQNSGLLGSYVRQEETQCNCRRIYVCDTCADPGIMYYDGMSWHVVPKANFPLENGSSSCGEPTQRALFVEDKAFTPAAIGISWSEQQGSSIEIVNSVEVYYEIQISNFKIANAVAGTYKRDGSCASRPAFRCVSCGVGIAYLHYVEARATWRIGPNKCQTPHWTVILDTAEDPTQLIGQWNEYRNSVVGYVVNDPGSVQVSFTDEFATGMPVSSCGPCDQTATLRIITDQNPSDISWTFVMLDDPSECPFDASTSSSEHPAMTTPLTMYTVTIPSLCREREYAFEIIDADGLCCTAGLGSYELYLGNQLLIEGGQFTDRERTAFLVPLESQPTFGPTDALPTLSPTERQTVRTPTVAPSVSTMPQASPTMLLLNEASYAPSTEPSLLSTLPSPLPTYLPTTLKNFNNDTLIPLSQLASLLPELLPFLFDDPSCFQACLASGNPTSVNVTIDGLERRR